MTRPEGDTSLSWKATDKYKTLNSVNDKDPPRIQNYENVYVNEPRKNALWGLGSRVGTETRVGTTMDPII